MNKRKSVRRVVRFLHLLPIILVISSARTTLSEEEGVRTPFRPLDIFEFETASDPRISPDGKRIVYVRGSCDIKTDSRYTNLWIVDRDGTNHRALTTGTAHPGSPRWSSSGDRIAYLSDEGGSPQIHVRWMDTGQTIRVTHMEYSPAVFSWSPDGKWIAFFALVAEKTEPIATAPAPPEGAEWSDPPMVIDRLPYRFDQRGYLTKGHNQLFIVPAEGGTARRLTSGPYRHGGSVFSLDAPVWTPDGESILITAHRVKRPEQDPLESEIHEISVAHGDRKSRALTNRLGPDFSPTISPDGSLIAYLGFDDRFQGFQVTRLYVMNRDGSNTRTISADLDRSVSSPQFAADGKGVYCLYDQQGNSRLALISLKGVVHDLVQDIGVGGSAYPRPQYSLASDGSFAFPYTRSHSFGEIAIGFTETDPPNPTRILTSVNADLFAQRSVAPVEEIWFRSSKDGREIQGWIVRPPDFETFKDYPLILEIHGGPFANYGDRFDIEKQLFAAQGYIVFYCNPRGSTSYGEEFGNLIHHAYPGDDYFDLDAGVDAVIERGSIDERSLFVTGGSGGGVLTCWMIGRTDRFRAAASAYPVINWASFTLNCDIPAFVANYWFPGMPWDEPQHYWDRSLLSVIENVITPTMVITGEEDYRTPISESEQYFQALQLLEVESVLVRFPEEPHGIRRRPSHHMAKIQHIAGWFDRYKGRRATQ